RMPELSALMGIHSLGSLEKAAIHRNHVADRYRTELGELPGVSFQEIAPGNRSSYREYSIMIDEKAFGVSRDVLSLSMTAENIDTRKYYDPPTHRHEAYSGFARPDSELKNTDRLSARSLSLPMWSDMSDDTVSGICRAIRRAQEFAPEVTKALG